MAVLVPGVTTSSAWASATTPGYQRVQRCYHVSAKSNLPRVMFRSAAASRASWPSPLCERRCRPHAPSLEAHRARGLPELICLLPKSIGQSGEPVSKEFDLFKPATLHHNGPALPVKQRKSRQQDYQRSEGDYAKSKPKLVSLRHGNERLAGVANKCSQKAGYFHRQPLHRSIGANLSRFTARIDVLLAALRR
jgi:hypothetical protein